MCIYARALRRVRAGSDDNIDDMTQHHNTRAPTGTRTKGTSPWGHLCASLI